MKIPGCHSNHQSKLSIGPRKSSILHPASALEIIPILASRTSLVPQCVKVHLRMSLMSSSLFLEQRPAYLVHLTWMICEIEWKWPYSSCFVGYCFWDLFKTSRSVFVLFPSRFFSIHFVKDQLVHSLCSTNTATTSKKSRFILPRFRFPCDRYPFKSNSRLPNAYDEIAFSRWDI